MLKDYRILAVLSLFSVGIIFFSLKNIMAPDYAQYQKEYYDLTKTKEYAIEINQVNVKTGSGVVIDRCQSCHIGVANEHASGFAQPLTLHPPIVPDLKLNPHDFNQVGCIVCHEGNGRGLTKKDAHGEMHHWFAHTLKKQEVQASCVKCHISPDQGIAGAPLYNRGKQLFIEEICWACHTIDGLSAGKTAPDLTDAGNKFTIPYLKESIVDPKANTPVSKMPKFFWVSQTDIVEALAIFLKGQKKVRIKDLNKTPIGLSFEKLRFVKVLEADGEMGRYIFMGVRLPQGSTRGGCVNCHSVRTSNGVVSGGVNAPDLTFTYRARGSFYLQKHIQNPRKDVMDSNMPAFAEALNDHEIKSLIMYLKELDYLYPDPTGSVSGEKLYTAYCNTCHGEKLDGRGKYAELLDPLPRDFSRYQFVATYNDRFVQSINDGVPGTAMPPWQKILKDQQIRKIVAYIEKETTGKNPAYKRVSTPMKKPGDTERMDYWGKGITIEPADNQRGKDAFQKFCTSCHGKLANGKGPNAYFLEHPLPRNLLNTPFITSSAVDDLRLFNSILLGVPGSSMPAHDHLRDQTILDMIAFINSLNKGGKK